jgi:hypothetical protein
VWPNHHGTELIVDQDRDRKSWHVALSSTYKSIAVQTKIFHILQDNLHFSHIALKSTFLHIAV